MKIQDLLSKITKDIEKLPENFQQRDIVDSFLVFASKGEDGKYRFDSRPPSVLSPSEFHEPVMNMLNIKNAPVDTVPSFKSVHFESRLALGDALMMTCGIRDFKATYPEVKVSVRSTAPRVWDNNPYIERDLTTPEKKFNIGTGWLTNKSNAINVHMANAYRLSIQNETGLQVAQGPIRPDIWLSEEEYNAPPIVEGPYWIIIKGGEVGWPLKMYPISYWQVVVDSLPNIKFVELGTSEHVRVHGKLDNNKGNVIDMVGKTQDPKTGIRDLFRLFLHAQGSVGLVSMQMHLAAAFNIPCVVVAGAREPAWFTQYLGHQYLHMNGCLPCAETKACWHCKTEACTNLAYDGKTPRCAELIEPHMISEAISMYYIGGRLDSTKKIPNTFFKNIRKNTKEQVLVTKDWLMQPKHIHNKFTQTSISREGWDALEKFCKERNCRKILEYGPGVSTDLFKSIAETVHSIEAEPTKFNVGLDTLVSRPDGRYDMAFIDGPKGSWSGAKEKIENYSRFNSVKEAMEHTDCIILHNAKREAECRISDVLLSGWKRIDLNVDRGMVAYIHSDGKDIKDTVDEPTCNRPSGRVSGSKGLVKILTSCRGYGGSEKSTLMLMRMFSERGYQVQLVPWGGKDKVCAPYREAIPEGVAMTADLKGECDILVYYATDTVYFPEMKEAGFDEIMSNLKANRKVMCINYRIGHLRQKDWAKTWDTYIFLCSQKKKEWERFVPFGCSVAEPIGCAGNGIVLPPPTDLTDFFEVKRRYHLNKHLHLIRHNAQGDAKWPKNINDYLEAFWEISDKIEWSCMPAASFMFNDSRIHKYAKNQIPIPEFLSNGNCFIYNLPDNYSDQGPRVILEAQATGLPVIADNRWGAADRVNEETGWLCNKPGDYLSAILDITGLVSLLATKGKAARKFAKDNYDPYKWVEAIVG